MACCFTPCGSQLALGRTGVPESGFRPGPNRTLTWPCTPGLSLRDEGCEKLTSVHCPGTLIKQTDKQKQDLRVVIQSVRPAKRAGGEEKP